MVEGEKETPKKREISSLGKLRKKLGPVKDASLKALKVAGKVLAIFFAILFLTGSFFIIGMYFKYSNEFKDAKPRSGGTQAIFYDKNGDIIYEGFGTSEPDYVPLSEIPDVIKKATLAAEDKEFYNHGPINVKGILRATLKNWQASEGTGLGKISGLFHEDEYSQGGSSITQQLVKNRYLESEKSFERKLKELVYSYELEKKMSKDQILEQYLNYIYYGEQALGIKNAARVYFDKDLKDLSLAEASLLAGLPAAPSKYSIISGDYDASKKRQEYVLQQMIAMKMITEEEGRTAANKKLELSGKHQGIMKYPYFVQYVKQELIDMYGFEYVETGGLKVYTTLDPATQDLAEAKAKEYVDKFKYARVSNASVVVLDNKTNNVLAMVGGVDWEDSKVNVALSARQPGSSFKPIVYATGFEQGYTPLTKLLDSRINFGGTPPYIPRNYNGGYMGNVSARTALANSLNIPTVEMGQLAGIDNVINTAKKMGITTLGESSDYGLSLSLGSGEVRLLDLALAYSAFADGGKRTTASGIVKVLNNTNENIYKVERQKKEVLDPRIAYQITSILSDTKARQRVFGYGNKLEIKGHTVAAKTGTTDNYTDSWTMGYSPNMTVGVWMGNNDRSKMGQISGIEGAAYVWHDVMEGLIKDKPDIAFEKPRNMSEVWVNQYTFAKAPRDGSPYSLEYFLPGTEPKTKPDFSYLDVFTKKKTKNN
ncbi:PBP1A family penicillin-binding protein [candidate division WS5 bacterium]|uniref:PBP1A family penicillin-binding protein n=1 Tax=candidate division WS5 bacterium TaxID=2093353 RepID=A0A419DEK9_9BACT|nr:MAG: PBP1A family penicillin-binding protein [candidate division WS5 bacterium]